MNQAEDPAADANQSKINTIDVRTVLKKNLVEEFTIALAAQTTLTERQRAALIEAVQCEQVNAISILQIISRVEDQP